MILTVRPRSAFTANSTRLRSDLPNVRKRALADGMIRIIEGQRHWIAKHNRRFFEQNAMFSQVCRCLGFIPDKFQHKRFSGLRCTAYFKA